MEYLRKKPVVFVSSTCYDLSQVREDLKDFFEDSYGFEPMLSEFDSFPIDPCIGTFENCLSNVDNYADIFVLVVGTRYGYVTEVGKSITNLEYLHAKAKGIPMFVFVSKQIYNNLPVWRANKDGDFSAIVDNPKIFDFVSDIYDEAHQWIYTYENVRDIKKTLKNQLSLIFSDGLKIQRKTQSSKFTIINSDIPSGAIRAVVEQPFAWEYKFLAHVLKGECDKLKKHKWDLQYGFFEGVTHTCSPEELVNDILEKLHEATKLTEMLGVIMNTAFQDAIAENGVPSDLELMVYTAKRYASIYKRFVEWSLYFKTIQADDEFSTLLDLLCDLPKSVLLQMEEFANRLYKEIVSIPDVDDGIERTIHLTCTLDCSNTEEINNEIERINHSLQVF